MITPYLSDPDFVTHAMKQLPDAASAISGYSASPACAQCQETLEAALIPYRNRFISVLAEFREAYGRDAKARVIRAGKQPLNTVRTIAPSEFKDLIKDLISKHTWSSMSTKVNPDGTWQLTFS